MADEAAYAEEVPPGVAQLRPQVPVARVALVAKPRDEVAETVETAMLLARKAADGTVERRRILCAVGLGMGGWMKCGWVDG